MKNHYQVLGLAAGATEKEIYSAFRKLAKIYHPDSKSSQASSRKFQELKESYESLKDAEGRKKLELELQVLQEIDRFQALSRVRQAQTKRVANGHTVADYPPQRRRASAQVIDFPKKEIRKDASLQKVSHGMLELLKTKIMTLIDAAIEASERASDLRHRVLTRELNKIPEREIGAS